MKITDDILTAALAGYQIERAKIDQRIAEIQAQLRGKSVTPIPGKERQMSAAGRKRIADASRKRWAAFRAKKAASAAA